MLDITSKFNIRFDIRIEEERVCLQIKKGGMGYVDLKSVVMDLKELLEWDDTVKLLREKFGYLVKIKICHLDGCGGFNGLHDKCSLVELVKEGEDFSVAHYHHRFIEWNNSLIINESPINEIVKSITLHHS